MAYKEFVAFRDKLISIDPNEMISVGINTIDAKDKAAVPNKDGKKIAKIPTNIRKYIKKRYPNGIPKDGAARERSALRESLFKLLLLPALARAVKAYMPTFCGHEYYEDREIEEFLAAVEKETKRTRYQKSASAPLKTGSPASFIESFEKHHADNIQFAYGLYYWFYEKIREPRYIRIIDEHLFGYGRSLGSVLGKATYWGQTDEQVDQRVSELIEPFYGRKNELTELDAFLESNESGLIVLSAPAGSGKSALLANWQQHRYEQGDKVALHFVSNLYGKTTETRHILGNLLHQVWCHIGKDSNDLQYGVLDDVGQSLFKELSAYPKDQGRLVLVLDGLDEADGLIEPFVEAGCLPDNVFVVVSARQDSEETPPSLIEWEKTRAKEPNNLSINLEGLDESAVVDWLIGEVGGLSGNEQDELAKALKATTEGLPLFLYYVIDDLRRNLPELPDKDTRLGFIKTMPAPFPKYIAEQIRKLSEASEESSRNSIKLWTEGVERLFATLSITMGPIHRDDLKSLLGSECPNFTTLDHRLSRWFSIRQGNYSYAHPKLARAFAQVIGLSESEINDANPEIGKSAEEAEDALIVWMDGAWKPVETRRGAKRGAEYALDWLPEHLARLGSRGETEAAKLIANPAFLDERLRQSSDLAAVRLSKNCDLWAALPFEAKKFDGARQWGAFWAENETSIKATTNLFASSDSIANVVAACLGDAATAGSGTAPEQRAILQHKPKHVGLIRLIDNAHISGIVKGLHGRYASWGMDGAIRFWDATGEEVTHTQNVHGGIKSIFGVSARSGGYISWGRDKVIRYWDFEGIEIRQIPNAHCDAKHIRGVSSGAAGGCVSWGDNGAIRFWDSHGAAIGHTPNAHGASCVTSGVLAGAKQGYASWGTDGAIRFWDDGGNLISEALYCHGVTKYTRSAETEITNVVTLSSEQASEFISQSSPYVSPKKDKLSGLTIGSKANYFGWNRFGGFRFGENSVSHNSPHHSQVIDNVWGLAARPEGGYVSWGRDGCIRFWEGGGSQICFIPEAHGKVANPLGVVVQQDGACVSWGGDGSIRFWTSAGESTGHISNAHDGNHMIMGVIQQDTRGYISWGYDGFIRTWSASGEALGHSPNVSGNSRHISKFKVLAGEHTCVSHTDGILRFWNIQELPTYHTLDAYDLHKSHFDRIVYITAKPDGGYISWDMDCSFRFWGENGQPIKQVSGAHENAYNLYGIFHRPDGGYISWGNDGSIHFWDAEGNETDCSSKINVEISGIVAGPEGTYVSWGADEAIRFWNAKGREFEHIPNAHGSSDNVAGVSAGPKGGFVSWGSYGAIRFWGADRIEIGSCIGAHGKYGSIFGMSSGPEGEYVSWGRDCSIRVWSADGKELFYAHEAHGKFIRINRVVANPNGGYISWAGDGTIRFWNNSLKLVDCIIPPGEKNTLGFKHSCLAIGKNLLLMGRHSWVYPLV